MRRRFQGLFLLLAVFMFGLASCKKGNESPSTANRISGLSLITDTIVPPVVTQNPANQGNPYDSTGIRHNALIDLTAPGLTLNATTNTIIVAFENSSGLTFSQAQRVQINNSINAILADSSDEYDDIIDGLQVTTLAKGYLHQIKDAGYSVDSTTTYAAFKSSVTSIETTVSNNPNLTAAEKKLILKSASIARYSMKYWVNQYHYDDVVYANGPVLVTTMGAFRKILRAIHTVYADYVAQGEANKMQLNDDLATVYVAIMSYIAYVTYSL